MNDLFLVYLSLSASGTILICLLFFLKKAIKNYFSQTWQYYIWILVIIRLLIPVIPETSLINQSINLVRLNTEASQQETVQPELAQTKTTLPKADRLKEPQAKTEQTSKTVIPYLSIAAVTWMLVAVMLLAFRILKYLRFKKTYLRIVCLWVMEILKI